MQSMVEKKRISTGDIHQRRLADDIFNFFLSHQFRIDFFDLCQSLKSRFVDTQPFLGIKRCQWQIGYDWIILILQIRSAGFDDITDVIFAGDGEKVKLHLQG